MKSDQSNSKKVSVTNIERKKSHKPPSFERIVYIKDCTMFTSVGIDTVSVVFCCCFSKQPYMSHNLRDFFPIV